MNEDEIRQAIRNYKFYHIIQLTENIATPGNPVYVPAQELCLKFLRSVDLQGKRVLDIGCRDGLFSFAAERMGAQEVIGIDNDLSKPATEFLIPFFKSAVRMHKMNLYDLTPDSFGLFDVVIFPGVLYHLRYPFWGLKAIRDVMKRGGHVITETAIYEGQRGNALLFCPIGDESPYEPTSCTIFNEKGLRDTLTSLGFSTVSVEYSRPGPFPSVASFPPIAEVSGHDHPARGQSATHQTSQPSGLLFEIRRYRCRRVRQPVLGRHPRPSHSPWRIGRQRADGFPQLSQDFYGTYAGM